MSIKTFTFLKKFEAIPVCSFFSFSPNDNFGQQCCYGKDGVLVKDDPGGSTDASSPVSNYYAHVLRDLLPYILCCKDVEFSPCDTYYYGRPSGSETGYMFPKPGRYSKSFIVPLSRTFCGGMGE